MSPIVHCVTSSDGRGEDSSTEADKDNSMDRYNNMDVTTDESMTASYGSNL